VLHGVNYRVNYIRHYTDSRKARIRFVMAVRPSVRTHRKTRRPLDGFDKTVEKLHVLLNSSMEDWYLHIVKDVCKTNLRRILLTKRNFLEDFVDKIKKIVLCLNLSLLKTVSFMR
jgi:hypothetical protein